MAFVHGSKAKVYGNGYDLSPYLRSFSFPASVDSAETSTFGNTFKTYVPGITDFTISASGIYDDATNAVGDVFNAALNSATDDIFLFLPQGDTAGLPGYGCQFVATGYEVNADIGDVSQVSFEGQGDGSIDRVLSFVPLGVQAGAFNSASIDNGAQTTLGGVFYVIQTAAAGAVTYKIQDSADNSSWADVSALNIVTAAGRAAGRTSFVGTVRRYVRVTSSTGSTFAAAFSRK